MIEGTARYVMRRSVALSVFLTPACAAPRPSADPAATTPTAASASAQPADVAAIRAVRAASNAAIARRDAAATAASMMPAYSVLPAGAPAQLSRDSTQATLQRQFADPDM